MEIIKTTYTLTVIHDADESFLDLEHALSEAWDGCAVGAVTDERTEAVSPDNLTAELVALGNDGAFFDEE